MLSGAVCLRFLTWEVGLPRVLRGRSLSGATRLLVGEKQAQSSLLPSRPIHKLLPADGTVGPSVKVTVPLTRVCDDELCAAVCLVLTGGNCTALWERGGEEGQ